MQHLQLASTWFFWKEDKSHKLGVKSSAEAVGAYLGQWERALFISDHHKEAP